MPYAAGCNGDPLSVGLGIQGLIACYTENGAVNGIRTRDPKNHNLVL